MLWTTAEKHEIGPRYLCRASRVFVFVVLVLEGSAFYLYEFDCWRTGAGLVG